MWKILVLFLVCCVCVVINVDVGLFFVGIDSLCRLNVIIYVIIW